MKPLLEVRNAWYSYPGGIKALRGAELAVSNGEVVSIIGANGCGKTTLLLVATGLLEPEKGEVLLNGKPLTEQLPEARKKLGLVFQEPDDQLFNPTVYDEIAFALRQLDLGEDEVKARVNEIAKRLGVDHLLDRAPYRLSIGEKKKVAIASILVYEPEIILFDEPTANLSIKAINELEKLIKELRSKERAIVVTSHNIEFVARIADRVYVMDDGATIGKGDKYDILTNEALLSRVGLTPPFAVRLYKKIFGKCERLPLTIEEFSNILQNKYRLKI
ncbi:MAG: energy-coupling factor ABC transporter ATP-binding protein [Candidatus Nezhaarchaeales archaeon]